MLLIEPDPVLRDTIAHAFASGATVDAFDTFEAAREQLATKHYHLVVSNIRLQEFNGIHLAYVIKEGAPETRVVVYANERDAGIAIDAQRACAFFELINRIPIVVRAYLAANLPARDRRDVARFDRRQSPRGGRRVWDLYASAALG